MKTQECVTGNLVDVLNQYIMLFYLVYCIEWKILSQMVDKSVIESSRDTDTSGSSRSGGQEGLAKSTRTLTRSSAAPRSFKHPNRPEIRAEASQAARRGSHPGFPATYRREMPSGNILQSFPSSRLDIPVSCPMKDLQDPSRNRPDMLRPSPSTIHAHCRACRRAPRGWPVSWPRACCRIHNHTLSQKRCRPSVDC